MSVRWTQKHIDDLVASGKVKAVCMVSDKPVKKPYNKIKPVPKAVLEIKNLLDTAGISYVTEHYFAKPRMFRFDIAIVEKKVAIEYEGIVSNKSRHTSIKGYTRDATKYNLAATHGWKVYRYTALNYKNFESDLKTIINSK